MSAPFVELRVIRGIGVCFVEEGQPGPVVAVANLDGVVIA